MHQLWIIKRFAFEIFIILILSFYKLLIKTKGYTCRTFAEIKDKGAYHQYGILYGFFWSFSLSLLEYEYDIVSSFLILQLIFLFASLTCKGRYSILSSNQDRSFTKRIFSGFKSVCISFQFSFKSLRHCRTWIVICWMTLRWYPR